ncbi:MAG: hypothetical protein AAGD09_24985 [Cyanobacteria bacterium P01_F01_bin.56]
MEIINRCKAGFYQWVQKDIEREVDSDLYLLRQIKGNPAITSCCYLDTFGSDMVLDNLKSFSNRFLQNENAAAVGKLPSEIDRRRWKELEEAVFVHPINIEYIESFYKGELFQKIRGLDKKLLRRQVKEACSPYLGKLVRNSSSVLYYETYIQNFRVFTEIDLGGWTQLRYLHSVQYDDGTSDVRQRVIMTDFLRWLGLGETAWGFMTDEDIPTAANVLGELCSNFMKGMEQIISDAVD